MDNNQPSLENETFFVSLKKLILFYLLHFVLIIFCSAFLLFFMSENKQNRLYIMASIIMTAPVYVISLPLIVIISIINRRINYIFCGLSTFIAYNLFYFYVGSIEESAKLYNPHSQEFPLTITFLLGAIISSLLGYFFPRLR